MKIHLILLFILFHLLCFSQQKNKGNSTSHSTIEETEQWLNEKYQLLKPDSVVSIRYYKKNSSVTYYRTYPKIFTIQGKFLHVIIEKSVSYKPFGSKYLSYESGTIDITIDLTSIDTVRVNNDTNTEDEGEQIVHFNSEFIVLKTKNGLNAISVKEKPIVQGTWFEEAREYKTDSYSIVNPKNEEQDIRIRFINALKYYIKLCKQTYPVKKDLF